jgi:hypothetical protein
MSLYSFVGFELKPKLYAERESGLNILVREVLFEDFFNKIENQSKVEGVN